MSETFVSPAWLATNREDVAIVDVRRSWDFEQGHVPGAVNVPFEEFRDPGEETPGKLPTADGFASTLGDAGITPDDRIVAYDDDHGVYASRFLVTAEIFGHDPDRLHLIDGDFEVWSRDHETTAGITSPKPTEYDCEFRKDTPLISASELESALDGDAIVVDTRDEIEYDTVHLPGAVNFQWRSLVDSETGQLRPRYEVRSALTEHGITPDRPVRLYCNTARRLSFVYAVLECLDYGDVAFYEGGIDEWAEYGGPVETTFAGRGHDGE